MIEFIVVARSVRTHNFDVLKSPLRSEPSLSVLDVNVQDSDLIMSPNQSLKPMTPSTGFHREPVNPLQIMKKKQ